MGDGRLPHPGTEGIVEAFYRAQIGPRLQVTADYQHVWNPGYDTDRGPADVLALRGHVQF